MATDLEELQDQVDRARLKMWTEYGIQLGLQFTEQFTDFLAEEMGLMAPAADGPQPPVEIVGVTTASAEVVVEDKTFGDGSAEEPHDFRVDRGGKNCIECDLTESKGNHT